MLRNSFAVRGQGIARHSEPVPSGLGAALFAGAALRGLASSPFSASLGHPVAIRHGVPRLTEECKPHGSRKSH